MILVILNAFFQDISVTQIKNLGLKICSIFAEVVKLDVTKADAVKQQARKYGENSGVLIYISPMDFKVFVIGDGYEKMNQALHQVKVSV